MVVQQLLLQRLPAWKHESIAISKTSKEYEGHFYYKPLRFSFSITELVLCICLIIKYSKNVYYLSVDHPKFYYTK